MAAYVKGLDPNHLLTLGEEGFYSTSTSRLFANPGASSARTSRAVDPACSCRTCRTCRTGGPAGLHPALWAGFHVPSQCMLNCCLHKLAAGAWLRDTAGSGTQALQKSQCCSSA